MEECRKMGFISAKEALNKAAEHCGQSIGSIGKKQSLDIESSSGLSFRMLEFKGASASVFIAGAVFGLLVGMLLMRGIRCAGKFRKREAKLNEAINAANTSSAMMRLAVPAVEAVPAMASSPVAVAAPTMSAGHSYAPNRVSSLIEASEMIALADIVNRDRRSRSSGPTGRRQRYDEDRFEPCP